MEDSDFRDDENGKEEKVEENNVEQENEEKIEEDLPQDGDFAPPPPPPPIYIPASMDEKRTFLDSILNPSPLKKVTIVENKDTSVSVYKGDSRNELKDRLQKKSFEKADKLKDEFLAMKNRIENSTAMTFAQARNLLKDIHILEHKLTQLDNSVLTVLQWDYGIGITLASLTQRIGQCEARYSYCQKLAASPKKDPVQHVKALQDIVECGPIIDAVLAERKGEGHFSISEFEILSFRDKLDEMKGLMIKQCIEIALERFDKIEFTKTKFDTRFRVSDTLELFRNLLKISTSIPPAFRPKELLQIAQTKHDLIIQKYSSELNGSSSTLSARKSNEIQKDLSLHDAVNNGNLAEISKIIAEKPQNCDILDSKGFTPLTLAILKGDSDIVKLLAAVSTSWRDLRKNTYLHVAVMSQKGNINEIIKILIEAGIDVNSVNSSKATPLHASLNRSVINMEVVKILIRFNADLFAVDETGRTPLSLISVKFFPVVNNPPSSKETQGIDFSIYFMSKTLSDVTFVVEGQKMPAHRIVLCVLSGAFRSLLEGDFKESSQKEVSIQDVPALVFKSVLEFCYTGKFRIPKEDVAIGLQILEAAERFLLDDLKKQCEYSIQTRINLENAFQVYTNAKFINSKILLNAAASTILNNYDKLAFADVDKEILYSIVNDVK